MKLIFFWCSLCIFCSNSYSQTRVILDMDIDSDVDDVAALAMVHQLASNRKLILSAVIVTSDDPYAPLCVEAINTYFGKSTIPIGFKKSQAALKNHSRYTRQISENFPHQLTSYMEAWEAVSLYRKILNSSADGSVVIVTVGHLTSLQDLLQSDPDKYSTLSGKALVLRKVSRWICMGGIFPAGKEANFYRPDPQSTVYCLAQWTKPVIFCGWEIGNKIISGGPDLKSELSSESPVYMAFELYNQFAGRPSWDQVAILLLTEKWKDFFAIVSNGKCQVEPDGSNKWITGAKSNHSYIILKSVADKEKIAAVINNMTKKQK
ncbi:MAG: nucleoside hydrolase [Chitinophagaceae bacterium]